MHPEENRTISNEPSATSQMDAAGSPNLSPPHTWTESDGRTTSEDDDSTDNRHLFTVIASMPDGTIYQSRFSDAFLPKDLCPGANVLNVLDNKGKSFLISASTTSYKQRLFCRVKCVRMSHACELLCKFEEGKAHITALALRPAYGPSTPSHSVTFITKHSPSCALTHIDYASIPYLGHLPTEMLGRSILSLFCAADVNVIRQAHFDLYYSQGRVVKSIGALRFVAHNGALICSETEWSAFVNPWTKTIDMVVAKHRIVGLPIGDANVLAAPPEGHSNSVLPAPLAKAFEDELRTLMSKPVPSKRSMCQPAPRPTELAASLMPVIARPPPDLGSYIERIVEQLVVATPSLHHKNTTGTSKDDVRTDLPLTYEQINCLENVRRYFNSQSRPQSPSQSDTLEERRPLQAIPLTREALLQHTRRWEEDYRDTWHRRLLKRMSSETMSGAPPAKHMRPVTSSTPPIHWSQAQREEFYRSQTNPPPPPGKNFQITSVPLLPSESSTTASSPERTSAFTAVAPKSTVPIRELPTPIALSIHDPPSVIQSQQPLKMATDALLMLHESR